MRYALLILILLAACATPKPLELEFPSDEQADMRALTVLDDRSEDALFYRGEEPVRARGSVELYLKSKIDVEDSNLVVSLREWSLEQQGSELKAKATLEAKVVKADGVEYKAIYTGTSRKISPLLTPSDEVEVLDLAMSEAVKRLSEDSKLAR